MLEGERTRTQRSLEVRAANAALVTAVKAAAKLEVALVVGRLVVRPVVAMVVLVAG